MATTQYCYHCERKCRALKWYGPDGHQFCGNAYVNMYRRGYLVRHPTWPVYEENIHRTDETDARICAAVYRKDALALREGAVFLSRSMLEPVVRMLVSLLASTFYFAWPAHAFIHRIIALECRMPGKATLFRIGGEIFEQFRAYRVVDGQLVVASPARGISVTKNPSERQCGRIRFNAILEDLPDVIRTSEAVGTFLWLPCSSSSATLEYTPPESYTKTCDAHVSSQKRLGSHCLIARKISKYSSACPHTCGLR